MNLLVIRHARAESVKEFARTGASDDVRPLTEDGRERMRLGAAGLRKLVDEVDVLASSPLLRARQTAEIIASVFEGPAVVELDELRPGTAPELLAEWLADAGSMETIVVVGHDLQLREMIGWFLTGKPRPVVAIKKGGAVMLELRARGRRGLHGGSGTLHWSLTPRQLRMLGG